MIRQYSKVLVVDAGGTPREWISYNDAILYVVKNAVSWIPPTAIKSIMRGGTCAKTGAPSTLEIASIMAIRGPMAAKLMATSYRTPTVSGKSLFARDHNRCAYCGGYFNNDLLTKDHILPKKLKGKNTWMNLITSCKPCNSKKADRTLEKSGMKLKYQPYIPSRVEYLYLANASMSSEQIEYIEGFDKRLREKKAA